MEIDNLKVIVKSVCLVLHVRHTLKSGPFQAISGISSHMANVEEYSFNVI